MRVGIRNSGRRPVTEPPRYRAALLPSCPAPTSPAPTSPGPPSYRPTNPTNPTDLPTHHQPRYRAAPPWHSRYETPDRHQQSALFAGGQGTARPRAARVVAYWGSRSGSAGEAASEAAKAS